MHILPRELLKRARASDIAEWIADSLLTHEAREYERSKSEAVRAAKADAARLRGGRRR